MKTPVDRFILDNLEQKQLKPAAPSTAGAAPPGHVRPDRPAAHAGGDRRVPGRSFAPALRKGGRSSARSPHYGERWGRHWLDVVRYAESTANDANAVMRYAWRYRDYVIDAFNRDLPYDQFLIEQLAGDLLPPTDFDRRQHPARHRHRIPDDRPQGAGRDRQGTIEAGHRRRPDRRDGPRRSGADPGLRTAATITSSTRSARPTTTPWRAFSAARSRSRTRTATRRCGGSSRFRRAKVSRRSW